MPDIEMANSHADSFRVAAGCRVALACLDVSGNDLAFVRLTMQLLHDRGIRTWLFGGWAKELLGLIPPRPHHDLDLLYPAGDFGAVDALLAASPELFDIPAKRLPRKRAFLGLGIMTELILIRPAPAPAWITDF